MPAIAYIEYIVERQNGHWTVRLKGGDSSGCYESRRQALDSALRDAERVRNLGHEAHVAVRHANGTLRRIPDRIRSSARAF